MKYPLVPEDISRGARPSDTIVRAVVAKANRILGIKAATAPAKTTQAGWAEELARESVADLVVGPSLGPPTAASGLFGRSIRLSFGRAAVITVPTMVTAATGNGFIGEGAPIPVKRFLFLGPKLTPHKLPIAVVISNEMFETPNAEAYIRLAMSESLAADLDPLLLDDQPASDIRPAGLRNGVAGLTPTTGGGEQAMVTDLAALIGAVAPVGGSRIALVCSTDIYVKMILRPKAEQFPYVILETSGLAATTIMAVATNALAVAFGDEPGFTLSDQGTIHASDTPQHIGSAGSPPVVAEPTTSMFQTQSLALRLVLDMSWTLRVPNAAAWVANVTW